MSLKSSFQKQAPRFFGAYHFMLAWLGAQRHNEPSRKMFVIGVTGTKGKTTTLELLNAILETAGKQTALLSSLRMKIGDTTEKNKTGNSMPGRGYIQKFINDAYVDGCKYALIEVTSQGVAAHRHRFVHWNMGVMTNLAPEHIEAHGSFENYRAAKLEFLKYTLAHGGKIFLNCDDKHFGFFAEAVAGAHEKVVEVSADQSWFRERLTKTSPMRLAVDGRAEHQERFFMSRFNQENFALAAAVAKELGISEGIIEEAIGNFAGVPGRMEFVFGGPYLGIVDYAHTPDSLEAAYRAARSLLPDENARLICVLGAAGGGRDKWKRPEMGKIAAHYCDEIVLTDEDPYDEKPEEIIEEVAAGIMQMPYPRPEVSKVLDRREALMKAIDLMKEGDIVIATGKGSEDWIHKANGKKIFWSEKTNMQDLLLQKEK